MRARHLVTPTHRKKKGGVEYLNRHFSQPTPNHWEEKRKKRQRCTNLIWNIENGSKFDGNYSESSLRTPLLTTRRWLMKQVFRVFKTPWLTQSDLWEVFFIADILTHSTAAFTTPETGAAERNSVIIEFIIFILHLPTVTYPDIFCGKK